jgi:hypothetical protein
MQKKLAKKGGWAGAGFAASSAVGPAGSAGVAVTKYRKDLIKGGTRKRTGAMGKIGAPIAVSAAAGPAGAVGYGAGYMIVTHRSWIKRHLFRHSA